MPIIVDRKYLENFVDVLENKKHISEETRENMIKQCRRLIQVDILKEEGKRNGRPKKIIETPVDFHFLDSVSLETT